jgi:hypothetical protein
LNLAQNHYPTRYHLWNHCRFLNRQSRWPIRPMRCQIENHCRHYLNRFHFAIRFHFASRCRFANRSRRLNPLTPSQIVSHLRRWNLANLIRCQNH